MVLLFAKSIERVGFTLFNMNIYEVKMSCKFLFLGRGGNEMYAYCTRGL